MKFGELLTPEFISPLHYPQLPPIRSFKEIIGIHQNRILFIGDFDVLHKCLFSGMTGDPHDRNRRHPRLKALVAKDRRAVWVVMSSHFS